MNVLIVPSWYKNEKKPILGSFFEEQARTLLNNGHNVYVADATLQGFDNLFSKRMFKLCKYDDDGLITYSRITPGFGLARTVRGGLEIFNHSLEKIYKTMISDGIKIDVIHAHSFFPAGIVAVWLGKKYGIPVVVTEHNSLVLKGSLHPTRVGLLKETVENSAAFVCVSQALKKSVVKLTGTKKFIEVIPNLVDSRFRYREKSTKDMFTYSSIGNLIAGKRFDLTLKAFARVRERVSNAQLIVVGGGVLRASLEQMAMKLNIADFVEFKGVLSRDEVADVLSQSDVFVLPSDFETFGVVYIEALASGVPIVATRNGGAEAIVSDDNGILTDIGDEDELYNAMLDIYDNYDRYDLKSISKACKEIYGEDSIGKKLSMLYERIAT